MSKSVVRVSGVAAASPAGAAAAAQAAAGAGAGGAADQPRLAPHFPFAPRSCATVADAFFDCFTKASFAANGGDGGDVGKGKGKGNVGRPGAAVEALRSCAEKQAAYDACVGKHLKDVQARVRDASGKGGLRLQRAPDAYRE